MSYHGDIRLGDTIDLKFTTCAAATGAPTTLSGSPAVACYPSNSTTEITAGVTLTVDFDARTGLNNVRVVATGGNGYATATNYEVVITAGTVGGTSAVGYVVASFSIENRSAIMSTTAANKTMVVDANGRTDVSAVQGIPQFTEITVTASGGSSNSVKFPASTVTTAQCPVGGSVRVYAGTGAFQMLPVTSVTAAGGYVTEAFGPAGWSWPVTNVAAGATVYVSPAPGYPIAATSDVWAVASRQLSSDGNAAIMTQQMTETYAGVGVAPNPCSGPVPSSATAGRKVRLVWYAANRVQAGRSHNRSYLRN